MNQQKLDQLKAAGGVAVELIEEIEHLRAMNAKAVICMDEQKARIDKQLSCLAEMSSMCVGELTMGYRLDAQYIGQAIYGCTGKTNPELNDMVSKNETIRRLDK